MKNLLAIILLSLSTGLLHAQVGFNNSDPDVTAIVDFTATDKGLLIPRLTSAQRDAIAVANIPARSLLVFDTTEGKFYFYDGGTWYALNELVRAAGSNEVSLPTGNLTVGGNLTVTNNATVTNTVSANTVSTTTLNVTGYPSNAVVPAGVIVMWSGSLATIPMGWALCDGSNGTPDLRERFVVGAGSTDNAAVTGTTAYTPGNNGGANSVTLTANQLPTHTHAYNDVYNLQDGFPTPQVAGGGADIQTANYEGNSGSDTNNDVLWWVARTTGNNTTTGSSHENRPPYWALAFIMKLP